MSEMTKALERLGIDPTTIAIAEIMVRLDVELTAIERLAATSEAIEAADVEVAEAYDRANWGPLAMSRQRRAEQRRETVRFSVGADQLEWMASARIRAARELLALARGRHPSWVGAILPLVADQRHRAADHRRQATGYRSVVADRLVGEALRRTA